jgi:hypothetical protein
MEQLCDSQLTDDNIGRLVFETQRKQRNVLINTKSRLRLGQFQLKVDDLRDYFNDVSSELLKFPIANHKILWLVELASILSVLKKDFQYFSDTYLQGIPFDSAESITKVLNSLVQLNHLINEKLTMLLKYYDQFVLDSAIVQFADVVTDSLCLLTMDKCESDEDNSLQLLKVLQTTLLTFYQCLPFEILVGFIKSCYLVGQSSLVVPFLAEVFTPKLGIEMVDSNSTKLSELINYHKYMAYNLVALSLDSETITEPQCREFNDTSEIHFRILLNFPNLATHIYTNLQFGKPNDVQDFSLKKDDNLVVSLQERQEISWLYVINSLLRLSTIQQLSDPNVYFKQELDFLNESLPDSLSKYIGISASSHGSAHSSVLSIVDLANKAATKKSNYSTGNKLLLRSLSAIFSHGGYKEKSNLIVNFIKHFNPRSNIPIQEINGRFSSLKNDHMGLIQLFGEDASGKFLYVKALNRICKILTALTIKFLVENGGLNEIPLSILTNLTNYQNPIQECLEIIKSIKYQIVDDIVHFEVIDSTKVDMERVVNLQLSIHENTSHLNKIVDILK